MLAGVKVDVYGSEMPLNQLGQILAADAQLIIVKPYDTSTLAAMTRFHGVAPC